VALIVALAISVAHLSSEVKKIFASAPQLLGVSLAVRSSIGQPPQVPSVAKDIERLDIEAAEITLFAVEAIGREHMLERFFCG
jgi:hypothetical protein